MDICQSCGMPLNNDENKGTESDGTLSQEYCKFCYQNGSFTDEGTTLEEKIEKNVRIAVDKMGMDEDEARSMASNVLPNLKRWKK
jgi:hypothetical protein